MLACAVAFIFYQEVPWCNPPALSLSNSSVLGIQDDAREMIGRSPEYDEYRKDDTPEPQDSRLLELTRQLEVRLVLGSMKFPLFWFARLQTTNLSTLCNWCVLRSLRLWHGLLAQYAHLPPDTWSLSYA